MTMEQKFNALAAYVLAESQEQREIARKALNAAMRLPAASAITATTEIEDVIHQYLFEMSADPSLCGYKYIVYGIQLLIEQPHLIDSITFGFYPMIAAKFDTTASRAERAIRHAIEKMFDVCDIDTVINNFGNCVKADSGKPTNGAFFARSVLNVKARLKN